MLLTAHILTLSTLTMTLQYLHYEFVYTHKAFCTLKNDSMTFTMILHDSQKYLCAPTMTMTFFVPSS